MRLIMGLIFCMLGIVLQSHAAIDDEAQRDYWRKAFTEKRSALVDAREQLENAKTVQNKQRRDDYPLGNAKIAIDKAVTDARVSLESAKESYLQLFEQARKQGALPGWYRDFEDELPTLLEVEEINAEEQFPEEVNEIENEETASEEKEAPLGGEDDFDQDSESNTELQEDREEEPPKNGAEELKQDGLEEEEPSSEDQ